MQTLNESMLIIIILYLYNLDIMVDESILTGESVQVNKNSEVINNENVIIAEQSRKANRKAGICFQGLCPVGQYFCARRL